MILVEEYYQIEIPFPVAHLKNEQKLVLHVYLLGYNSGDNRHKND